MKKRELLKYQDDASEWITTYGYIAFSPKHFFRVDNPQNGEVETIAGIHLCKESRIVGAIGRDEVNGGAVCFGCHEPVPEEILNRVTIITKLTK